MRKIYAQGDWDGACFLYSIVNAYVALRREQPEFAAVCRAFGQVDHPGDFLNGSVGTTGSYDSNYGMLEENIRRALSALGAANFAVRRIAGRFSEDMLKDLLGSNSVVLVRYMGSSKYATGMDHWVCAMDYDEQSGEVLVACSVRLHKACDDLPCAYAEKHIPKYDRWWNDALSKQHDHTIVSEEVFQITMP